MLCRHTVAKSGSGETEIVVLAKRKWMKSKCQVTLDNMELKRK
jgi:hypothetical protein